MFKKKYIDFAVILGIIIFSLSLQLFFLNPPILSDQLEYYKIAVNFPRLPENPNIASMRLGLILPVALLYRVFGHSELAYYALPLLSTALASVSIYLIGAAAFNRRVGLISAVWLQLIPNVILNTGHLLPDMGAAAFFTAGVALIAVLHPHSKDFHALPKKTGLYFLAGILFGWAYLTKEYIAVLYVLIPILFWALDIPLKRLVPVALGMLLTLALELGVGYIYYENPTIRFNAASPRDTEGHIEMDVALILRFFPILLNRSGGIGTIILAVIGIVGSFIQSIKKQRIFLFLIAWEGLFYLFFTLMGLLPVIFSWEDIVLLRLHKFRYWLPILPPLILSGMGFLDQQLLKLISRDQFRRKQTSMIIASLLSILLLVSAWSSLITISSDRQFVRNGADHYLELREFLAENNDQVDTIWVTRDNRRGYARLLPIYTHDFWGRQVWDGRMKYLNTEGLFVLAEEIDEGYVIIDRDFNDPGNYGLPLYMSEIPSGWRMVFESENQKLALYAVDAQ